MPLGTLGQPVGLGAGRELCGSHGTAGRAQAIPRRGICHRRPPTSTTAWTNGPNDENNHAVTPIYVNLSPLADLVASDVVAPEQAVEGAEIEVRYTVTNLRVGRNRRGSLAGHDLAHARQEPAAPGAGRHPAGRRWHIAARSSSAPATTRSSRSQMPDNLESGTWYITPWTDPYDVVLEDTLATNINPDDPHEIDNNNYKARAITIIALPIPKPDLVVESVEVAPHAYGRRAVQSHLDGEERGPRRGGTGQRVGRSRSAVRHGGRADRRIARVHSRWASRARATAWTRRKLHRVAHRIGSVPRLPAAMSVVMTDATVELGSVTALGRDRDSEDNNLRPWQSTNVQPVPADLVVTDIARTSREFSGEQTTITFTVTNIGQRPVWSGTKYWRDHIWVSADPEFDSDRATYLGTVLHNKSQTLGPLARATRCQFEATLPTGLSGDYYLYVHVDVHHADGYLPVLYPLGTGWWLSDAAWDGWRDNRILTEKHFDRWAFEDPDQQPRAAYRSR